VKAWHWLKDDMHSGSGRERAWVEGEERTHFSKTLLICERGYHSSPTPWDGLSYAQGNVLCLVEISEPEAQQDDKYVSRTRKLIKAINVEHELRAFACDVAEEALTKEREAGREPDARSWNAIAVGVGRRQGRRQGRRLGRRQGRRLGRRLGRHQGRRLGRRQGRRHIRRQRRRQGRRQGRRLGRRQGRFQSSL
jgi:hypothetical protein